MVEFTVISAWSDTEKDSYDDLPEVEKIRFKRAESNRRFHCTCGRFVKASAVSEPRYTPNGAMEWHWTCTKCGYVTDGT